MTTAAYITYIFRTPSYTQVVHDVTNTTIALRRHFGTVVKIGSLFDTQLAFEIMHGDFRSDDAIVLSNSVAWGKTAPRGPSYRCRCSSYTSSSACYVSSRSMSPPCRSIGRRYVDNIFTFSTRLFLSKLQPQKTSYCTSSYIISI